MLFYKTAGDSSARETLTAVLTEVMSSPCVKILAASLQSALIKLPLAQLYNPRLTRFPYGFQLFLQNAAQTGLAPNVGKKLSSNIC
ncbi:MAG: hypothetical protein F6K48_25885 [Okeania sp. SIO3H1]|uniref:hypothetical protein n=1 Tax=Okeania sp. SIO1I7 TaxID=2607772 RepID=UPI0013C9AEC9|nr:hypothetical protein [Okeania sp. SIO3H1]NET24274.1 hypothetical protein [Okeania sp. SIO1I7]